jgi:hypothetical protein
MLFPSSSIILPIALIASFFDADICFSQRTDTIYTIHNRSTPAGAGYSFESPVRRGRFVLDFKQILRVKCLLWHYYNTYYNQKAEKRKGFGQSLWE